MVLGAHAVVDGEDRVTDELARAVVGDVTAPLDGDQLGADCRGIALEVRGQVGTRPVGEHMGMLQEQQVPAPAVVEQGGLDLEGLSIRNASEPPKPERGGSRDRHNSVDQSLVSRISFTRFRKPAA